MASADRQQDITVKHETGRPAAGYILALVSSMGAGAATVTGKWNLEWISPLLMNSLIFTIATVMLSVWVVPRPRFWDIFKLTGKGWFWLMMFSLSSWIAILGFWAGVQKMDPTLAAFLNRSEVMVAILLGIIFLGERFNKIETLGAVLSIAGIVIMKMTLRMEYSTGFWLVLLGSLFFGITEFVSKIAVRYVEPLVLAYVRNMFLAAAYWIVFWGTGMNFDGLNRVWIGVILLGFFGPILSRMLYLMALKRLELSKVAVISQSQPVWVILLALGVFSQLPTFREIVGGLFLMFGCLLMIVGRRRPFRRRAPQVVPPLPD